MNAASKPSPGFLPPETEGWSGLLPAAGPGSAEWMIKTLFGPSAADAWVTIGGAAGRYADLRAILKPWSACGHFVSTTTTDGLARFVALDHLADREWLDVGWGVIPTAVVEISPKVFQFIFAFEQPVGPVETNPGAATLAHLPSGTNRNFRVRLVEASGAKCNASRLALALGLGLNPRAIT